MPVGRSRLDGPISSPIMQQLCCHVENGINRNQQLYIASVVVAYWIVSISAVYVNKGIMSKNTTIEKNTVDVVDNDMNHIHFVLDAPIFIIWFQCLVTVMICGLAGEIGERVRKSHSYYPVTRVLGSPSPKNSEVDATTTSSTNTNTSNVNAIGMEVAGLAINNSGSMAGSDNDIEEDDDDGGSAKGGGSARHEHHGSLWAQIPRADFQESISKKVRPLSLIFVGMLTFNNLCLRLVHVSYYTMSRSLTILFNILLSKFILGIPTSSQILMCLAVVVLGFLMKKKPASA